MGKVIYRDTLVRSVSIQMHKLGARSRIQIKNLLHKKFFIGNYLTGYLLHTSFKTKDNTTTTMNHPETSHIDDMSAMTGTPEVLGH